MSLPHGAVIAIVAFPGYTLSLFLLNAIEEYAPNLKEFNIWSSTYALKSVSLSINYHMPTTDTKMTNKQNVYKNIHKSKAHYIFASQGY